MGNILRRKMGTTKIEWCEKSWNPITGCSAISEGCQHCYAKRMANRLQGRYGYPKDNPFAVTFHPDKLNEPLTWKKPRKVFVCSMGDLFHEDVPFEWIRDVFRIMMFSPSNRHTYLVLTKRPKRLMEWMRINYDPETMHHFKEEHPNIWLGVTAENQARADERIPILLSIPAAVRFVSVEPMLGPVDLWGARFENPQGGKTGAVTSWGGGLDWVIAGPETGPKAREFNMSWMCDLWSTCKAADVPFFDKRDDYVEREWPK